MSKKTDEILYHITQIPTALKNFKNLKKIFKDPVSNSSEVIERKKAIYPYLCFAIIIGLISFLLSFLAIAIPILGFILTITLLGSIIFAVYCGIFIINLNKQKEKFNALECPNCKNVIKYDNNVTFNVSSKSFSITRTSGTDPSESTAIARAVGTEHIYVQIKCTCQACKTEKNFSQSFESLVCNKTTTTSYVESGARAVEFERTVQNDYDNNFDGMIIPEINHQSKYGEIQMPDGSTKYSVKTAKGVNITYHRTPESLVKEFFGN